MANEQTNMCGGNLRRFDEFSIMGEKLNSADFVFCDVSVRSLQPSVQSERSYIERAVNSTQFELKLRDLNSNSGKM